MSEKARIVIVRLSTRIYPEREGGGPAKVVYYLSRYSASPAVKMINIACVPPGMNPGIIRVNDNFEIHHLSLKAPPIGQVGFIYYLNFCLKYITLGLLELLKIKKKHHISIVHAHSPTLTGIVAFFFKFLQSTPYFFTYHGIDAKNLVESIIGQKIIHPHAFRVITITQTIKLWIIRARLPTMHPVIVLPNGIDCPNNIEPLKTNLDVVRAQHDEIMFSNDNIVTIYVGHMMFEQKVRGMIDFLNAFDRFLSCIGDEAAICHKLLFIGDGPFKKMLVDARSQSKHLDNINILGLRKDVPRLISIARLSALTSYVEGFPNVLLESMAFKVPCIATRVGDVPYILGDTGYLVSPGDVDAMADALVNYYSDKNKFHELGSKAFNRVKGLFDWYIIARNMRAVYLDCLRESGRGSR